MEAKWGMLPDMAGLQTIRSTLRQDIANELIMTGEPISAEKSLEYALVTSSRTKRVGMVPRVDY